MAFTIAELIANQRIVSVESTATVGSALDQMIANDFSQLPIVDAAGKLLGIVSEQSISQAFFFARGRAQLLDLPVHHCQARAAIIAPEAEILEALSRLKDAPALIAVSAGKPVGVITYYDTTVFLRDITEGLMFAEDIELGLRRYIEAVFDSEEKRRIALIHALGSSKTDPSQPAKPYDQMTFHHHIQVISCAENWAKFEPYFQSKDYFLQLMGEAREIRNQLAHFRDRATTVQKVLLRQARNWIETRPPAPRAELPTAKPAVAVAAAGAAIRSSGKAIGRYAPLAVWLNERPVAETRVELSFQQIEELLGDVLPPSAHDYKSWWANDPQTHSHARYWLGAGWGVETVDLDAKTVVFDRQRSYRYKAFFGEVLGQVQNQRPGLTGGASAPSRSWLEFAAGVRGFRYGWAFTQTRTLRIVLYIDTGDKIRNEELYDQLLEQRGAIESRLRGPVNWARLDDSQSCRIYIERRGRITDSPPLLDELKKWAIENMVHFHDVVQPLVEDIGRVS